MFGLHNFGSHDPSARADLFSACLSVIGFGGLMFGFSQLAGLRIRRPGDMGAHDRGSDRHRMVRPAQPPCRQTLSGGRGRRRIAASPAATAGSGRAQEPFVHHRHHHGVADVLRLQFDPGHHAALYPDRPRLFGHDERSDHAAGGHRPMRLPILRRTRDGPLRSAAGGLVRLDRAGPRHPGHVAGVDGHVDLVGVDLPVHPSDRHGLPADADHHMVAELSGRTGRGVRRFIGDEHRPADRRRGGRPP